MLAAFLFIGVSTSVAADPFPVYLPTRIDWLSPFPFALSSVSATSTVYTDVRNAIGFTTFQDQDPTAGPTDVPAPPGGSFDIFPAETILWSLGGTLSFNASDFPICAYAGPDTPSTSCDPNTPPTITLATLPGPGFGSFTASGDVFAFMGGEAILIGTWQIHSDQNMIAEPASIALFGMALVALFVLQLPSPQNAPRRCSQ